MQTKKRGRWIDPLSLTFALTVTTLVLGTLIPALYVAISRRYRTQVETETRMVHEQGELIRIAFEQQMLADERELIRDMVEQYSENPNVERVMILNREGEIAFASDPSLLEAKFDKNTAPTCTVCHSKPPEERAVSVVVDTGDGTVIRSAIPFRNREACHECHEPTDRINGILVIDTAVNDMRAQLGADIRGMIIAVVLIALILLGGSRLVIRRVVLAPLSRLETRARAIAAGDFGQRVEVHGDNALAHLGQAFNEMADSVASLLGRLGQRRVQLENIMNSVEDGLLVIDETFTIVGVNKSFARRLGVDRRELMYRRCCEIWGRTESHCARRSTLDCPGVRCFSSRALETESRMRYDEATGTERQEEIFASPIMDGEGRVIQVVEVWRDITERKSREANLAEIEHLASLGMLASGFSHEINTPLNTIMFCTEDLRRSLAGGKTAQDELGSVLERVELIRGEILRCSQITKQFLSLSRGQSLRHELLDVARVIEAVVPIVEPTARAAGVKLRVAETGALPVVLANSGAVQQVLLNLMINAVQASAAGDEVTIVCRSDSMVRVEVVDGGAGMAADVQKRIFEPFFSRNPTGTGLGLFVSRNLARQWGGDIEVSSEPEVGSTFEVSFPTSEPK